MSAISYTAPPICALFMLSETFIRALLGPVGSGKTTACIFELFRRAAAQTPSSDGYRYTRFGICRQTLQQLKMTVLKDIMQWLPGIALWRVSESTIYIEVGDIKSEWVLLPLEDPEDQRRLLSMQLTGAWISECIEINSDLVSAIAGRCNRYPSAKMGGCTHAFIIMDTNFPEEGSKWWELFENPPPDWTVYKQPGGLHADAENLDWLAQTQESLKFPEGHPIRKAQGRTYYERLARGNSQAWVDRYVHAKYGIDPSGRAVFGAIFWPKNSYGMPWHVVKDLQPYPGGTIIVGQDFGRDPCAIITQVDQNGRLQLLEEIICRHMGLQIAYDQHIIPVLRSSRYLGLPIAIIGDPAGAAKDTIFEVTSIDFIKSKGFFAFPAHTNDIDPRIRSIESWLLGSRMAGAAMVIDQDRCPVTINGLKQGYRYENLKSNQPTAQSETKPKPLKNDFSHIIDALQYACLATEGGLSGMLGYIQGRMMRRFASGHTPAVPVGAWT